MSKCAALTILLIFCQIGNLKSDHVENIVNLQVTTTANLRNQLAYVRDKIIFLNKGPEVLENYLYSIPRPKCLYIITFYNLNGQELPYKQIETNTNDPINFEVTLLKQVASNQTSKLYCKITYAKKILPASKKRKLEENQLVKYDGNLHFFSPYDTQLYTLIFQLPDEIISFSKPPDIYENNQITYTSANIKKNSINTVVLIFINNNPFLVIKDLQRTISISHFGKISIQDIVTLENNGPKFVGPYFRNPENTLKAATNWLYTHLPASAENIKFFDNLGNLSQSSLENFFSYITFKFKVRYPLLGGWKTSYILQYDVPIHEYVYKMPQRNYHFLQIRAVDNVLNDKLIENAVVKIILPEGGYFEDITFPKLLNDSYQEISFLGGLCILGRQTLVLNGYNLFENYVDNINVVYYFDPWSLLRAPLLISFHGQIIFLVYLCGSYLI